MKKIVFLFIYYSGLWCLSRYLNRHRAIILMYHGVINKDLGIWTQVPQNRFDAQMSYIAKNYHVLPLHELIEGLKENKLPSRAVAVTFDDGYENNASLAFPTLQKYNIPATFFVTTGFVERNELYDGFLWTDFIYVLLNGSSLPSLDLSDQQLIKFDLSTPGQVVSATVQICSRLKCLLDIEKQNIIKIIRERTGGIIKAEDRKIFAPMSWEQIRSIKQNPLVSIGAHTVHHPILSRLDLNEAEREIVQSKLMLEQKLNSPINAFAYPNGCPQDISYKIVEKVSENFTYALSTDSGFNDKDADFFALCRLGVGNDMLLWQFKLYLSGMTIFLKNIFR